MARFSRRVWVQNRFEPVQTGLNRFHVVGKNVAVHVSYRTHIASLHYTENFSTYVVSRRHLHLHIAYNARTLRGQKVKVNKTNTAVSGTFE